MVYQCFWGRRGRMVVVDVCLPFPLEDCSVFGNFGITLIMQVLSTSLVVIGTDCISNGKFNYHHTTTTAPETLVAHCEIVTFV
jgi:hypothetical protein